MNGFKAYMVRFLALAAFFSLVLSGCGIYTFNPRGKSEIQSIAVARLGNKTAEFGLADQVTDRVIDGLIKDGSLKVLPEGSAATILSGDLTNYERKPYRYNENDQVQSYAVNMTFNLTLKNAVNDSLLWTDNFSQIGVYDPNTETEEIGQQRAIDFLVEAIINKTTKSW